MGTTTLHITGWICPDSHATTSESCNTAYYDIQDFPYYNGLNWAEMMFVLGIFLFIMSLRLWGYIFRARQKEK